MGAKMVDFDGWDMPVEYPSNGGIVVEHNAGRNGVGIFDVSHMGDIRLLGPEALFAVQHITMNDASRLAIGQVELPKPGEEWSIGDLGEGRGARVVKLIAHPALADATGPSNLHPIRCYALFTQVPC